MGVMTQMATSADYDSEHAVIEAVQQGDDGAFRELWRRQDRWVRGVVFGVLGDSQRVDDVSQQVWTSVWQRVRELRDVRRWRAWLYRLARNAAVDAGRGATRDKRFNQQLADAPPDAPETPAPPRIMADHEAYEAMRQAIEDLPALYREPFTLRHLEGWSYREIGELLDLPVDTVETRLVRARRQLRAALRGKV